MTSIVETILKRLDFEPDVSCDATGPSALIAGDQPCPETAAWRAVVTAGPQPPITMLLCDEHGRRAEDHLRGCRFCSRWIHVELHPIQAAP